MPVTFSQELKKRQVYLIITAILLVGVYYPIVPAMVRDWAIDDNYSHGFLVPLIASYFLWKAWPDLKERLIAPSNWGLMVLVAGCLQLLVAWLGSEYFSMRSSLIVLLVGIVFYWFGISVLKGMALPLGYLILMVPIPYIIYDAVAFPLKLFITKVSVGFLQLVGVVVLREGNIIMLPTTTLEVADACSGTRSLMSLIALAVAYAFFIQTSTIKRWVLIFSAIPIAIFTNAMRVIVTGVLAQWWGARAAEGFFHEFAGLAVFAVAMVLLVAEGTLLSRGAKC